MEWQVRKSESTLHKQIHLEKRQRDFMVAVMPRALTTQRIEQPCFFASIPRKQGGYGIWTIQVHFYKHRWTGFSRKEVKVGVFDNSFLMICDKDRRNPHARSRRALRATAEMQIEAVSWKQKLSHKMSLHMQFKRDLWEINFRKLLTYISVLQVPGKTFLWKYAVCCMYKSVLHFMVPYTES